MSALKKMAREYDAGNPMPTSKGKPTAKKEEGYVTPVSSPKASAKTPKKAAKRVAEDVGGVANTKPRRTRRKVTSVKYVEPELEFESAEEGGKWDVKTCGDEDEDEEWKPPNVEEMDGEKDGVAVDDETGPGEHAESFEEANKVDVKMEAEGERVTEGIKEVSSVLQESMGKANIAVVV